MDNKVKKILFMMFIILMIVATVIFNLLVLGIQIINLGKSKKKFQLSLSNTKI